MLIEILHMNDIARHEAAPAQSADWANFNVANPDRPRLIRERNLTPKVQNLNELAQVELFGTASEPGKLAQIRTTQGKAAHDYYSGQIEKLTMDKAFEFLALCQAKLLMDLREEATAEHLRELNDAQVTGTQAQTAIADRFKREDAGRISIIRDGGAFTRDEYELLKSGVDIYSEEWILRRAAEAQLEAQIKAQPVAATAAPVTPELVVEPAPEPAVAPTPLEPEAPEEASLDELLEPAPPELPIAPSNIEPFSVKANTDLYDSLIKSRAEYANLMARRRRMSKFVGRKTVQALETAQSAYQANLDKLLKLADTLASPSIAEDAKEAALTDETHTYVRTLHTRREELVKNSKLSGLYDWWARQEGAGKNFRGKVNKGLVLAAAAAPVGLAVGAVTTVAGLPAIGVALSVAVAKGISNGYAKAKLAEGSAVTSAAKQAEFEAETIISGIRAAHRRGEQINAGQLTSRLERHTRDQVRENGGRILGAVAVGALAGLVGGQAGHMLHGVLFSSGSPKVLPNQNPTGHKPPIAVRPSAKPIVTPTQPAVKPSVLPVQPTAPATSPPVGKPTIPPHTNQNPGVKTNHAQRHIRTVGSRGVWGRVEAITNRHHVKLTQGKVKNIVGRIIARNDNLSWANARHMPADTQFMIPKHIWESMTKAA